MPKRGRVVKTRAPKVEAKLAEGWLFIADTRSYPGGWGRGKTEQAALTYLRGHVGSAFVKDTGYVIWCAHPDSRVDHHGDILWPEGEKPLLVEKRLVNDLDLSEFEAV